MRTVPRRPLFVQLTRIIPLSLAMTSLCVSAKETSVALHPPELVFAEEGKAGPVAFYQAVPFAAGELKFEPGSRIMQGERTLKAVLRPRAYWPDGTVKWLGVEGVLDRRDRSLVSENLTISPGSGKAGGPPAKEGALEVDWEGDRVRIRNAKKEAIFSFLPSAAWVEVSKPKTEQPHDPDYLDQHGQYSWAAPIGDLAGNAEPNPLSSRIREGTVEEDNSLFTVYRIRGDAGETAPGNQLEWQLRLRCYKEVPLVRLQMTWVVRWNPLEYALASAKLFIEGAGALNEAEIPGEIGPVELGAESLGVLTDADGGSRVIRAGTSSRESGTPLAGRGIMAVKGGTGDWTFAAPGLARLGPNHVIASKEGLDWASWSERSKRALDLRRSSDEEDFGIRGVDLHVNGAGFARTSEASLIHSDDPAINRALAQSECNRDGIWFANAEDLERTGALGPFSRQTLAKNPEYFRGLHANLRFILASREHWKWNGYANFGDVRTNFALGSNPERGLSPGRWALNGRYGWRNGSGAAYANYLKGAILLADRELALAALDYARHVADVDIQHGSFHEEGRGNDGGMHRRNRDHWSGSVQMQYSPTRGLYLCSWLTGDERLSDVLEEARGFARRPNEQQAALSYAAQAWIYRYMETGDADARKLAGELLSKAAAWWAERTPWDKKSRFPLGSIYFQSTNRRIGEAAATMIDFHEATGDPVYLETLRDMAKFDGSPASPNAITEAYYIAAYALAKGVPADELGLNLLTAAAAQVKSLQPSGLPGPETWDYDSLAKLVTTQLPPVGSPAYRETNAISLRAFASFLVLEQFGNGSPYLSPTASQGSREPLH